MKKILSVITIMLMAFVLFACKGDKLTINFEANGGSEVTKMEISIDDLGKFVFPANPTKEGYEFKGWYLDPEFKDEFKSLTGIKNSITLYAKWEEVSNVKEFEVTFNTNGGSEVASQKVSENGLVEKPEDPTKEGFTFVGWFEDEALVKEFDFETKITENKTLYAKWEKAQVEVPEQLALNYLLDTILELTSGSEKLDANLHLGVDLKAKNLKTEDLAAVEASLALNGKLEVSLLPDKYDYTINAYVKNGVLYLSIPNSLIELITGNGSSESAENAEEPIVETYLQISLNLNDLYEALKAVIESYTKGEEDVDLNAKVEEIKAMLMEILGKAGEYGLDQEFINACVALVKVLEPKVTVNENTTIYEISDVQVKTFIVSLSSFISKYAPKVAEYVYDMINEYVPKDNTVTDGEGNVYEYGKNGWTDKEGNFHSFAEDTENEKGTVNEFGYYKSSFTGEFFDVKNNYEYVEAYRVFAGGNPAILLVKEGKYLVYKDGAITEVLVADDIKAIDSKNNSEFAYVDGAYYVPRTNKKLYYEMATGKLLTDKEYFMAQVNNVVSQVTIGLGAASGMFTINKLQVEEANDKSSVKFDLDADVNVPAEITGSDAISVSVKLSLSSQQTLSTENVVVEFPEFESYMDMTSVVIEFIKGLIPTEVEE